MPAGLSCTLAGCSKGVEGTSGISPEAARSSAVARPELVSATLQATTSRAIGTIALALCQRLRVRVAIESFPPPWHVMHATVNAWYPRASPTAK